MGVRINIKLSCDAPYHEMILPRIGVAAQVEFAQLQGQHRRVHQVVQPHREIVVESEKENKHGR